MVAGDHKFHPECFCCKLCSTFIGDGESYALIERSKLYCGLCYKRQMKSLSKQNINNINNNENRNKNNKNNNGYTNNSSSFQNYNCNNNKPLHSIRLVEIPWTKGKKSGIRLSYDENEIGAPVTVNSGYRGVRISE